MEHKMRREDRAKQFMPFAALKGYEEALRCKEKTAVPRKDLADEYQEELDRKLRKLCNNDMISVEYFYHNQYLTITGSVSKIDERCRILQVTDTKIPFEDIYEIF